MGMFDKFNDSVIFDNPCPPGCETCCPLDIQLAFDPVTNIITLTYIYDNATVVRTIDISHSFDLELVLNGNILELTGEHDGIQGITYVDLSPIIPPAPGPLCYCEDNLTYYEDNGTLLLTEYIIVTTSSVTLTLPANPLIGQMYKIYCTEPPGTTVNANVGQDIVGSGSSVNMVVGDGMIFQYIKTNQWGVINL